MNERLSPEHEPTREWSADKTVEFIKANWKGFFHNHPQETVRDPRTPELTVDVVSFFTETWNMDYHGTLQHMQKAYPEERVLSPQRIQKEAELVAQERGGSADNYLAEVLERLRKLEYHTPEDVEASTTQTREQSHEHKEVIGGAEVDLTAKLDADGKLVVEQLTPTETMSGLDVDYLVYSIHPDTNSLLKEIAGHQGDATKPGDPERLTQVYERMAEIAADVRDTNPHHPIVLAGHPLSRTEARQTMTRDQKSRVVEAFSSRHIPLEISLNDYYWWRPKSAKQSGQAMTERIPLLDPEFLELIKEHEAMIYVDTDLHFGDWLRDREREAGETPAKLGRQESDGRGFSAATMDQDLDDWQNKGMMELPRYVRPQVARFIRVVRHLLNSGIKPEQILNTKSLAEIRQFEGLTT